jgi:hypothetical protein
MKRFFVKIAIFCKTQKATQETLLRSLQKKQFCKKREMESWLGF